MIYKLAQNTIPKEDIMQLSDWLQTNPPLTMAAGNLTKKFEETWSKKIGVKYSIFCNSGSSANLLAYSAILNLFRNLKKIILCSAGWATTLSPIIQLGLTPMPTEVDINTFGINLESLETQIKKIPPSTPILVTLVHTLGIPNYIDEILELQKKYNFLLMEDACPAVGSKYNHKYVGSFGDISTFSFYYGHQISTIEGGMVCTNNKKIYDNLLMLRSHGWAKDLDKITRDEFEKKYNIASYQSDFTFYSTGYNLRPTEINAFLGLKQIEKLDVIATKRDNNFWEYRNYLKEKFIVPTPPKNSKISCITFPVITRKKSDRFAVYEILKENKIETRPISGGNLIQQPIWNISNQTHYNYLFAREIHNNGFVLPCHPEITSSDILYICDLLLKNI